MALRPRGLSIVLVASLLLVTAASGPALAQKAKLRVWLLRTYVPDANSALEDSIKRWAAAKGVEPVIEYFTFDDIETKYVAAIETNALPDVGQLQTIGPARYRGMGRLTDLTDLVNDLAKANGPVLDSALPVVRAPGGRFYAVPANYIVSVQFIRTDVFKKAGAMIPTTWEEVREANRLIKAKGVMEYPLGQSWNRSADGYGVFQALLYSYGGGWADEKGNYRSIMNDTWRQVVRWASEIYLKDKTVPPDAMSWNGAGNNEAYLAGKIAFTFNGPSIYYVLEKDRRPLLQDTLMVVNPAGPAGRNHDVLLMSWGVFNTTKQADLAKDLIRFVQSPDEAKTYMQKSWGQMVPAFENLRRDPYWQKNDSYKAVLEAPKYARVPGWPGPLTAAAAEVVATNVLTDLCARVIVDGWDIERALGEADKRIKDIYANIPSR
jgi:multiple sugar transport system substrate-binding protein